MNITSPDTPKAFLASIPREMQANLDYRKKLYVLLTKDPGWRKTFCEMMWNKPEIAYDSILWTFNPRNKAGKRNLPFILRPQQRVVVNEVNEAIIKGHDRAINKSRDEGATEIVTKLFALHWMLNPECMFLLGSRKEEYVDRGTILDLENSRVGGDHKCLFHKTLYAIAHIPDILKPKFRKSYMHFENLDNGAVIDGESTNENFAAGDRRTAIFLDEFGRVDYNIAKNIRDTVNDTSDCILYGSTHFYGAGHPFNKVIRNKATRVSLLPWYKNPEKSAGLYASPELNVIEIKDIDYYRQLCPVVFNDVEPNRPFIYSDFEKSLLTYPEEIQKVLSGLQFRADGCEEIPGDLRSPWHDKEELRRTRRDLSQNIWMCPTGASDMYFDAVINDRIRMRFVKHPVTEGEIKWDCDSNGKIKSSWLLQNAGKKRLSWYTSLANGRPRQDHNYIIGCDISLGTGASNSVACIVDANTREAVGFWKCPDTTPENFADQVEAISNWVGGAVKSYIIWENNGGQGINFGRRITGFHTHFPVYINTNEQIRERKRGNKYGWNSNTERKDDLLTCLKIALSESLKSEKVTKWVTVYDEGCVDELDDYIWYESGDIGASERADEKSGARKRHGDAVIALGLCLLAMKEQPKAVHQQVYSAPRGSMAYRLKQFRKQEKDDDFNSPWM